jgi:ppGpp synthetase/RelA/SpoT-type nucleotidyltranferase
MAVTLRTISNRFLKRYKERLPFLVESARQAKQFAQKTLSNASLDVHLISARPKDLDSVRLKLHKKRYRRPGLQLTDLIGVRVITYYEEDVAPVVAALRVVLEINEHKSGDKRLALDLYEFGYRSVHLIARLKSPWDRVPEYHALHGIWFEIQVRSILEHAWAEIEHEVIYKSGIEYPDKVRRRFARLAGALELLEDEFLSLKEEREHLIEHYLEQYKIGKRSTFQRKMDSAGLIAFLENESPDGLGWRRAVKDGRPFPAHIESTCIEALRSADLGTAYKLRRVLRTAVFKNALKRYLSVSSTTEPASHLALVLLAVLVTSEMIFADYFPEMLMNPGITSVLNRHR